MNIDAKLWNELWSAFHAHVVTGADAGDAAVSVVAHRRVHAVYEWPAISDVEAEGLIDRLLKEAGIKRFKCVGCGQRNLHMKDERFCKHCQTVRERIALFC